MNRSIQSPLLCLLCAACCYTAVACRPERVEPDATEDMASNPDMRHMLDMTSQDLSVDAPPDMMTSEDMAEDLGSDMTPLVDMDPQDKCAKVRCDTNQFCRQDTGLCVLPQSCLETKIMAQAAGISAPSDGFYRVFVEGKEDSPWWVWCAGMSQVEPADYLPLAMTHDRHNVFERFGEPFQPGSLGNPPPLPEAHFRRRLTRTRYEKVRIDPYTLTLDMLDDRFSSTTVFQDSMNSLDDFKRPVPFGMAQGCALQLQDDSLRKDARGRVDLRGTGFKLDTAWKSAGICATNGDMSPSDQGQVVTLGISGGSETLPGCGVVAPGEFVDRFVPSGCDGEGITMPLEGPGTSESLYLIKLAYVGGASLSQNLLPKTCEEALHTGACTMDGECDLYVGRSSTRKWKAKCVDMMTAEPRTFIEIHRGNDNSSQDDNVSNKTNNMGVITHGSFYGALRFDGHTMRADITDSTFANTTIGVQGHQLGPFAVSENCHVPSMASSVKWARARMSLEVYNGLKFATALVPYGECVLFQEGSVGNYTFGQAAPVYGERMVQKLIYGGEVTQLDGTMRDGCGGLAPEPYALKQGYLDCREGEMGAAYRAPRYSTEERMLFEFEHVSGNP